jgi:hypothetical protein
METLGNAILPNSAFKFYCNFCDYGTSKKSSFNDHKLSAKHQKIIIGNILETNGNENMPKICSITYSCEKCEKEFKNRSGLWKHNKKCVNTETIEKQNEIKMLTELVKDVVKQNQELTNKLVDICKNGTNNTITNNTNTNSHNKTFNLQFFLNETCKDAMNIMDFVDSIKLQLSDLEKVGKNGFVEGISDIIIKNLNSLDETKRPVHCTDTKREVMYVKDEDKWEKENETKVKLRKAIKHVAHKNTKMLSEFRIKNPDCLKSTSKVSEQYNKLVMEAMGGKGDNDLEKEDKIIKNIAKKVIIDKTNEID